MVFNGPSVLKHQAMASAHHRGIRDVLAWILFFCLSAVSARPIPKEQFATLGDFPDFAVLSENVTSQYFSNDVLQQFVHGLGEHYPDYVTVFKIGDSVNGAPILAMDIGAAAGDLYAPSNLRVYDHSTVFSCATVYSQSGRIELRSGTQQSELVTITVLAAIQAKNAPVRRDEKPYFLWVGNMHGNEPTGRPLLLSLALHLASSKGPLVQKVRNRMHTIIVPTMNPDGFKSAERNNANLKDLNRAFPDRADPDVQPSLPMTGTEEPEVQALMKLAYSLPITGAASLHEGALVANYPWDGDKDRRQGYSAAPSPDDATFQHLAKSYAQKHTRMEQQTPYPGTAPSKEFFKGGITNGNDWYPVYNGMQDWLYVARGCRALTLELWDSKWPSSDLLPAIWDENREAMLTLSSTAALGGVHGTLRGPGAAKATITAGGLPVHAYAIPHSPDNDHARRRLLDTPDTSDSATTAAVTDGGGVGSETHDVMAFAASADAVFHLPLAPGKYTITVRAPGAKDVDKIVEVPDSGGGVGVHVELAQDVSADAQTGADDVAAGVFETGFPYEAIAGRGASSGTGSGGAMMQVHPAGRLDSDSSDHDDRSTAGTDVGSSMATGGSDTNSEDASSTKDTDEDSTSDLEENTTEALISGTTTGGNGSGAVNADADSDAQTALANSKVNKSSDSSGGSVEIQEVAEEPPHSTVFFILRGAMAVAGVAFIVVQLLRLRGRTAAVGTAPVRRGHH